MQFTRNHTHRAQVINEFNKKSSRSDISDVYLLVSKGKKDIYGENKIVLYIKMH